MAVFRRIANLFRRNKVDREIEAELAAHLEMRIEDNLDACLSPKQARRAARLSFGNAALARMESRIALEELGRRWPSFQVVESGLRRVTMSNVAGYANVPVVAR